MFKYCCYYGWVKQTLLIQFFVLSIDQPVFSPITKSDGVTLPIPFISGIYPLKFLSKA